MSNGAVDSEGRDPNLRSKPEAILRQVHASLLPRSNRSI